MIGKQDILERAAEWNLRPEIVEKDYALGWLLAAFASEPRTATTWVFQGRHLSQEVLFRDLPLLRRPGLLADRRGRLHAGRLVGSRQEHRSPGERIVRHQLRRRQGPDRAPPGSPGASDFRRSARVPRPARHPDLASRPPRHHITRAVASASEPTRDLPSVSGPTASSDTGQHLQHGGTVRGKDAGSLGENASP